MSRRLFQGEHQPLRITPSRAKGTNGDIIAHRDDDQFESVEASRSERTNAMAATTSGDIIGIWQLQHSDCSSCVLWLAQRCLVQAILALCVQLTWLGLAKAV